MVSKSCKNEDLTSISYFFAYGTLRRGFRHEIHNILARHASFVGRAEYQGKLYHVGEYPAAAPSDETSDRIKGDVFLLSDPKHVLTALDVYEGCGPDNPLPHEFRREEVSVALETGKEIPAWIYVYNKSIEGLKVIKSGDYAEYLRSGAESCCDNVVASSHDRPDRYKT